MPAPASKRYNRMQKAAKQAVEEDGSSSSDEEIITLQKTVSSSSSASLPADEASATTENGKSDEVQPKKRKVSNARWTGDMDNALRAGVDEHAEDWPNVAVYAAQIMAASFTNPNGPSNYQQSLLDLITADACAKRWEAVGNDEKAKNRPNWGEAEKGQLTELVEQALNGDGSNLSKTINIGADKLKTISWVNIAKILNREPEDVNYMWTKMRLQKFKRGAFSTEEDRIIIARVREWYAKPADARPKTGLWVALEKELNREDKRISERWRSILSKRVTITVNESITPPAPVVVQPAAIAMPASSSSSDKPEPKKRGRKAASSEKDEAEPVIVVAPVAPVVPVEDEETPAHAASKPGKRKRKLNALNENQAAAAAIPVAAPEPVPTPVPTPVPVTTVRIIEDIIEKPESVRWNDEMDELLKAGMQLYNNDWAKIADHINNNAATMKSKVDDTKCRGRWYRALRKKD